MLLFMLLLKDWRAKHWNHLGTSVGVGLPPPPEGLALHAPAAPHIIIYIQP